ncbi:ABC transporter ATP-binding protein [Polymorphospora sp. NPDC051019]|uniref:ABC transporter ATP-binding protein n=1 Tax=Polymorphospora sp. NPDC051019 TaxID=3155725 RepID=UPI0034388792
MTTKGRGTTAGLALRDLSVRFLVGHGRRRGAAPTVVQAVNGVTLDLVPGRVLALVGESGCGKSVLAAAILGLLPANAQVRGTVELADPAGGPPLDLLRCPERVLAGSVRGRRVALVPQSAATHLTPVRRVRGQLAETVRTLTGVRDKAALRAHCDELAVRVGLTPADLDRFPHELSGGMAQRAALAFALVGEPEVVLADEPTAGLDRPLVRNTTAALRDLAGQGRAVLLITHDLAAAEDVADDLAVMYASRLVESGPAAAVLADPWHDYTRGLLAALPRNGLTPIPGQPPELSRLPAGCAFHARVPGDCSGDPTARPVGDRRIACRPGGDAAVPALSGAPAATNGGGDGTC